MAVATKNRTRPAPPAPSLAMPPVENLPGGVRIELVSVSPEKADDWLTNNNERNRHPAEDRVPIFAQMMRDGDFLLTHQGIAFDTDNQLADGQTRLAAIKASGVTVPMFVTWGLDPATRIAMDDTRKRTFAGDLQMNGVRQGHHVEALLRKIFAWEEVGGLAKANWRTGPSRTMLAKEYPAHAQAIHDAMPVGVRYRLAPVSQGSTEFMWWLLVTRTGCEPEVVRKFLSILTIGSQDQADRVLISCKDMFTQGRYADGRKRPGGYKYEIYYLIIAWNLWVTGEFRNKWSLPHGGKLMNPYPKPLKASYQPKGDPTDMDVLDAHQKGNVGGAVPTGQITLSGP